MSLTYASLCSGYGGLEMGVQSVLGGELSWYAEFDDAPSKIMAHHHPGIPNLRDITKIDWANCQPVDVITAGFPCQPFSHAGKRLGANDPRHLWPYIAQGIKALRPRLVVLENVRGLLSGQGEPDTPDITPYAERVDRITAVIKARKARNASTTNPYAVRLAALRKRAVADLKRRRSVLTRAIGVVLRDLADLGYDARWYGLRAADVGAAHGRYRIFIYATPADADHSGWGEHGGGVPVRAEQSPAQRTGDSADLTLLPTPAVNDMGRAYTPQEWDAWTDRMKSAHGNGNGHGKSLHIEAQRLLPTPTVSDSNGAGAHGDGGLDLRTAVNLLPTPRATRGGSHSETRVVLLPTPTTAPTTGNGHARNLGGETRRLPTPSVADTTGGRKSRSGDRSGELLLNGIAAQQDWREYEAAIRRAELVLGRSAPAPTEVGPKGTPRLSAAFVEWLMMLPQGWVCDVTGLSRNDTLKALGNGVVPAQAAAAARAFVADVMAEQVAA